MNYLVAGIGLAGWVTFAVGAAIGGCGASSGSENVGGSGTASAVGGQGGFDNTPPCVNLECQQVQCSGGVTTTVSGTVFDPSGTLPLYNVMVYVPNAAVGPLSDQLSCDQCDAHLSGEPLVTAVTDTQGRFVLEDVPVGDNIPLVIQVGKWRRIISIPAVAECVDTPMTDADVMRLPRSRAEGNLPRIALTTGSVDPLFCLLRRLGIADEEYGIMGSDARVHFYRGVSGSQRFDEGFGASPGEDFYNATETLWDSGWQDYDIVMLSCEAQEHNDSKNGHRSKLRDYINAGGRVFATHYHYSWLDRNDAPAELMALADFSSSLVTIPNDELVDINVSFPKGKALADWLDFVDGSSPWSRFSIRGGRRHTDWLDENLAQDWVRYMGDIMYFSFNAPVGAPAAEQCGRMVFSDIHVSSGAGSANAAFPGACNDNPLTEQEKALIFMLFDLSACVQPDDAPVIPPR